MSRKLSNQWFLVVDFFVQLWWNWRTPKLLDGFNCKSKGEDSERKRNWVRSLTHSTSRVRVCLSSEMGLGRVASKSITHMDPHKPNNKLVSAWLEHFWCTDEPRANTNSQNSPQPKLGGSHHFPPYSILCVWPRSQHPNVILSRDSQVRVPKFSKLGLLRLWKRITLCENLLLRWGLKQSCNLSLNLSNNMWHITYMQRN
jgi:hypothetical protein